MCFDRRNCDASTNRKLNSFKAWQQKVAVSRLPEGCKSRRCLRFWKAVSALRNNTLFCYCLDCIVCAVEMTIILVESFTGKPSFSIFQTKSVVWKRCSSGTCIEKLDKIFIIIKRCIFSWVYTFADCYIAFYFRTSYRITKVEVLGLCWDRSTLS